MKLRKPVRNPPPIFSASIILGGQIKGSAPRLFLIYPEGNFIESSADNPFFPIGETKYGRPILVRAYDPDMCFEDAMKLFLVSFDSTIKSNLSVGLPLDFQIYEKDSFEFRSVGRIDAKGSLFRQKSLTIGGTLCKKRSRRFRIMYWTDTRCAA